ncbi:MAG: hypothetical protein GC204_14410 [Chloroflexi bacterium]|nr:hypothetical protein [Chloroflexota bacterium]
MMPVDENTYRDLTTEEKLKQFLIKVRHCVASIVGYNQVLKLEVPKSELHDPLMYDLYEYLGAIERISQKFEKAITEINLPENNALGETPSREMLALLMNDVRSPISALDRYSILLEQEIQNTEIYAHLPPAFINDFELMRGSIMSLNKAHQNLLDCIG